MSDNPFLGNISLFYTASSHRYRYLKFKQKATLDKSLGLKDKPQSRNQNRICLKEFLMHILKVPVVMYKFKSFEGFFGKDFVACWNENQKAFNSRKTN